MNVTLPALRVSGLLGVQGCGENKPFSFFTCLLHSLHGPIVELF
jgi:hypothetical protein